MVNDSENLDNNKIVKESQQQNSTAVVAVAMKDVFHDWMRLCLQQQPGTTYDSGLDGRTRPRPSLQSISKEYFQSLSTTTSPSKAIALLIQILKPCFEKDTTAAMSSPFPTDTSTASSTITTKYLAVSCLVGSIQGCYSRNSNSSSRPIIATDSCSLTTVEPVTIQFIQLICNFLLPFIGPIDLIEQQQNSYNDKDDNIEMNMILAATTGEGEDGELYDTEQLRDLAMNGFISILQLISVDASSSSSSPLFTTTTTTIDELVQFVCTITMKGVEYRCSHDNNNKNDDAEDNDDMIYGFSTTTAEQPKLNNKSTVEYGLALLPRIRRSLCFSLLQNAVDTIRSILSTSSSITCATTTISIETAQLLVEYIQFVIRCLHGESDPRCLLQLLLLIYNTILEFYPHIHRCIESQREQEMKNEMITRIQNMISNVFDAVVPYYPIQFQPPPNDTIGITRQSLRSALINILSCTMYDSYIMRIEIANESTTTMSFYTCELLLDCLVPSPNDEPLSIMEQIDLLEDLDEFLFYSFPKESKHKTDDNNVDINLRQLNIVHQQGIADALIRIHEKSSLIVSSSLSSSSSKNKTTNKDAILAKKLADSCRSTISKIAITTERLLTVGGKSMHTATTSKNKQNSMDRNVATWQAFVEEPIHKVSTYLRQQEYKLYDDSANRIAIAYVACVASCGGSKTLQLCLQAGLVPLIQYLKRINPTTISNYNNNEKETVVTNVYGIGAFFSSCRVSIDIAQKDGIHWHPHPLEQYSNDALELLLDILVSSFGNEKQSGSIQITVAAIRSLESILLVSPMSLFAIDQVNRVIPFCEKLCQHLEATDATENPDERSAIETAYSQTFGTLLGQALDSYANDTLSDGNGDQLIIQSERIRQYFVHSLFPTLLNSEANPDSTIRTYNRQLLARSSAYSTHAASHVVQRFTKTLHAAITSADSDKAESVAASLAFLFEHENTCAAQAYHELAYPNISSLDIFTALLPNTLSQQSSSMEIGISTLQLPTSLDDRQKNSAALMKAYKVVLQLRKGYEHNLSTSQFRKLIEWTDKVLPPLSELDTLKLSIVLPALSAAMENFGSVQDIANLFIGEKSLESTIYAMIGDLTEFILSTDYHATARLHAARCIHSSIACFISRAVPHCPVEELISTKLQPAMHLVMTTIRDKSIEAQRREPALSSLLEMINILAMLGSAAACRGGGPSTKSSNKIVLFLVDLASSQKSNLLPDNENNQYIDLSDVDRDASTEISIQAARSIESILNTQNSGTGLWKQRVINIAIKRILEYQTISDDPYKFIGSLECLCHVLCAANLSAMVSTTQYNAVESILCTGLSLPILQIADTSTIKVLLASILKVLCVKPECFRSVYPLVTGSLRAFATLNSTNDGIICKLLSMQLLAMVAQLSETDFAAMDVVKTIRPAVLALLGTATDHPSVVLRSAAVEVRNIWTVVLET